jgi:hypothetical protein
VFLRGNALETVNGLDTLGLQLECLDLSENRIASMTTLLAHLHNCKNIRELHIRGNNFQASAGSTVGPSLEKKESIVRIEIVKSLTSNESGKSILLIDDIHVSVILEKIHGKVVENLTAKPEMNTGLFFPC